MRVLLGTLGFTLVLAVGVAHGQEVKDNYLASIYIEGEKSGQIHFTHAGTASESVGLLKAEASMSLLGFEVYRYEQTLREEWQNDQLQVLRAYTVEDGEVFDVELERTSDGYRATLGGQPVELPAGAYPSSVWHYDITKQQTLFDLKDLEVREVEVAKSEETIDVDGSKIATERFEFSGDWHAVLWFDLDQQLVQFVYQVDGHDVMVQVDSKRPAGRAQDLAARQP